MNDAHRCRPIEGDIIDVAQDAAMLAFDIEEILSDPVDTMYMAPEHLRRAQALAEQSHTELLLFIGSEVARFD